LTASQAAVKTRYRKLAVIRVEYLSPYHRNKLETQLLEALFAALNGELDDVRVKVHVHNTEKPLQR